MNQQFEGSPDFAPGSGQIQMFLNVDAEGVIP